MACWVGSSSLPWGIPYVCSTAKPWMCYLQHIPFAQGAHHDSTSPTHDRRHAGAESRPEHPDLVRTTGIAIRSPLQQVPRGLGARGDPCYQVYLTNEKKLAPGSVFTAVA